MGIPDREASLGARERGIEAALARQRWSVFTGSVFPPRMNRYVFTLQVSPEKYLGYYQGKIRQVIVRCTTGQTVQFPASLLQKFVAPEGIHGNFVLTSDENHKIIGLERLDGSVAD